MDPPGKYSRKLGSIYHQNVLKVFLWQEEHPQVKEFSSLLGPETFDNVCVLSRRQNVVFILHCLELTLTFCEVFFVGVLGGYLYLFDDVHLRSVFRHNSVYKVIWTLWVIPYPVALDPSEGSWKRRCHCHPSLAVGEMVVRVRMTGCSNT